MNKPNQNSSWYCDIAPLAITLALACAGAFTAQAGDVIGLNLCSTNNSEANYLDPGDYAGAPGSRTNNWNNLVQTNGNWSKSDITLANGTVSDSAGNVVSGLTVTFHPDPNGGGVGTYNGGGNTNDTKLFPDYNDTWQCTGFSNYGYLDITGIPFAHYKIYCYATTSDQPGGSISSARGGFFVVTNAPGGPARCYVKDMDNNGNLVGNPDSSGNGYVQSTTTAIPSGGASWTNVNGGNYVEFTALTNSSTRVWFGGLGQGTGALDDLGNFINGGDGAVRLKVCGFQIVQTGVVTNLYLQSTNLTLHAGNPAGTQLTVLADSDDGSIGQNVTAEGGIVYSVTDPNVATVSASGLLTPGTNGAANLVVTYQGLSLTNPITVLGPTALSLNLANTNLFVGNGQGDATIAALYANFSDATNVLVTGYQFVSFSGSGGVTVAANGAITAVSPGFFSLTGYYDGLSITASDIGEVAPSTAGNIIGLNIASPTSQNYLYPADLAGAPGARTNNWNNLVADANGSVNDITLPAGSVMDSSGVIVGGLSAVFHPLSTGGNVVNYGYSGGTNDPKMFLDYDDAFGGNSFANYGYLDLTGIPYAHYKIYCYYEPDNNPARGGFWLITNAPDGSERCYISSVSGGNLVATPDTNGNDYVQSKTIVIPSGASSWTNIDGGNYAVFSATLTNSSTRVWFGGIGNGNGNGNTEGADDLGNYPIGGDSIVRFKVCGFQIVQMLPQVVSTAPVRISFSSNSGGGQSGQSGQLELNWPSDHLGWVLETNSVGLTATNAWFPYPGSSTVTNLSIPIGSSSNVFFRLSYP